MTRLMKLVFEGKWAASYRDYECICNWWETTSKLETMKLKTYFWILIMIICSSVFSFRVTLLPIPELCIDPNLRFIIRYIQRIGSVSTKLIYLFIRIRPTIWPTISIRKHSMKWKQFKKKLFMNEKRHI